MPEVGRCPRWLAITTDGCGALVTNYLSGDVSVVDTVTGNGLDTASVLDIL